MVTPLIDDQIMMIFLTSLASIDDTWTMNWFHAALLFIVPLTYLMLRQRQLTRQQATTTAATNVAPIDYKNDATISATSILTKSTKQNDSTSRYNDDLILPPSTVTTTTGELESKTNDTVTIADDTVTIADTVDTDSMAVWKCNCFSGQQFLPKSIFGNMEAVLKMGTGECYHK